MENGTYAQINYNPDDLDDVCITEVECSKENPLEPVTSDTSPKKENRMESAEQLDENKSDPETEEEIAEEEPSIDVEPENKEELHTEKETEEMQECFKRYAEMTEDIQRTLRRLEKKFNEEILNGESRDSAVKTMYKELNEYKSGIVEKALKNVLYDMIDIREMMLSQIRFLQEKKGQDSISLEEFASYANDIGDILEKHDVTIYKGKAGEENIAVRQKIVRKVETEDDTLVKKVAESLSYGYEYGAKILYPEKISVYIKKKS